MTIKDIQYIEGLELVVNSQDVNYFLDILAVPAEDRADYDGLFVKIDEGELIEAYGFNGVPYLFKTATKLL